MRRERTKKAVRAELVKIGTEIIIDCVAASKKIFELVEGGFKSPSIPNEQYEAYEIQMLSITRKANIASNKLADMIFGNETFTVESFSVLCKEAVNLTAMTMKYGGVYLDIFFEEAKPIDTKHAEHKMALCA